jgi:dienelactone hydrolase
VGRARRGLVVDKSWGVRSAGLLSMVVAISVALGACASGHAGAGPSSTGGGTPVVDAGAGGLDGSPTTAPADDGPPLPNASGPVTSSVLVLVDPTRPTVARPPIGASGQRVIRTTVRRPATGSGPWPLVVFGHGFDISSDAYGALLDTIAAAGFVVAAPEFPGSSSALPGRPDEHDIQQEPCDLRFVADRVQATSAEPGDLSGLVRAGPVALAGQSDGASAAAFATLASADCPSPQIAAVVAFSAKPVPDAAVTAAGRAAGAALLAITGSVDKVNVAANTAALYDSWPGSASMLTSAGDGHLAPSTDSPRHEAIASVVVDFLRGTVGSEPRVLTRVLIDADVTGLTLVQRQAR